MDNEQQRGNELLNDCLEGQEEIENVAKDEEVNENKVAKNGGDEEIDHNNEIKVSVNSTSPADNDNFYN